MKLTILAMLGIISQVRAVGVHIMHPLDLKRQISNDQQIGAIDVAFGLQGHIDYGEGFTAKIIYPTSNTNGCKEFKSSDFKDDPIINMERVNKVESLATASEHHPIVLMDAGDCSHAVKSANAETYGFKGSFISSSHQEFIKVKVGIDTENQADESDERMLIYNRSIPEFIIQSDTSEKLIKYLNRKDAKEVIFKIDLSFAHPDNTVSVSIWKSSLLDIPDSLLMGMRAYHKIFKDKIKYVPRIATYSCEECSQEIKDRDCVTNGKYCAFLPLHDSFPDIPNTKFTELKLEGRQLILEALAERCTLGLAQEEGEDPDLHQWWLYIHVVRQYMYTLNDWRNLTPYFQTALGFDQKQVAQCVDYLFKTKGDYESEVDILRLDREYQFRNRIHSHPAVVINQQIYKGDLIPQDIAHAVCAAFKKRPRECNHKNIRQFIDNEEDWVIPVYGDTIHKTIVFIGLIIVSANILLLAFCKWRQNAGDEKAVVEMEVNQQVQNYFALRSQESYTSRD